MPYSSTAMFFVMKGLMSYADNSATFEVRLGRWRADANNDIEYYISTVTGSLTGRPIARQKETSDGVTTSQGDVDEYSPGINVPFSLSGRHGASGGSGYIQGAAGGAAFTADNTPTALPDLSSSDFDLFYEGNGFVGLLMAGAGDPGEAGIEEATA